MGDSEEELERAAEGTVDLRQSIQTASDAADGEEAVSVCDFCRMPILDDEVTSTVDDRDYRFCTNACRIEFERTDAVFTEYHGHRRIPPGVAGLDQALPEGIPRNSFVLLAGEAGTREDTLGVELMWRQLQRDEPVVLVTFTEPPISLVQQFLDMRWNVLPALERDQLRIVDCFTTRIDNQGLFRRRLNNWNQHLRQITAPQTTDVSDPSDPAEVRNKVHNAIDALEMVDQGAIHIDSLTEFGTLVQPIQAYDFIKDLRADICKGRFVPIFGGATRSGEGDDFPHDLSYVLDGIIELELSSTVIQDTLIRRVRVRKMNGVLAITEWKAFEFTSSRGLVAFDPLEQIASARKAREAEDEPPATGQEPQPSQQPVQDMNQQSPNQPDQSPAPGDPDRRP